jgi:hypothetical protein
MLKTFLETSVKGDDFDGDAPNALKTIKVVSQTRPIMGKNPKFLFYAKRKFRLLNLDHTWSNNIFINLIPNFLSTVLVTSGIQYIC